MKCKVHWLIDGLIEIEAFIKKNSSFFEEIGAKAVQGQAYLPGTDEK